MIRRHAAPHQFRRGILVSVPDDSDRVVESELIQCCHCQFTDVWAPGKERGWAFCQRCHDFCCPRPECQKVCRPWKLALENAEHGRPLDHQPVRVLVVGDVPKE